MWADEQNRAGAPAPRVATREAAGALVEEVRETMRELEKLLEVETAHLRAGRIRDGLSDEARKGALTSRYVQGLEALKANAVALARFVPEALERLKAEHAAFQRTIETNQVVLATARAVSEGLVRSLSGELSGGASPSGYGPQGARPGAAYGQGPARGGSPLVVSRSL
ncbi:hypothetical protein [Salinarimonas ramus]|uniref:FlgN protein n=1 Tax=Salinarimonas ramus TaxID=690164 RepID=A0A917Q6Q8_9HYPH|nr:hypothetical protein [Salinarimonas ramus]GGK30988.1 hypothetical protein GCM10011322_16940 [Salinarimonas ramus]